MTTPLLLNLLSTAVLALMTTLPAQARTQHVTHVQGEIPFAFQVGERQMPAGKYTIMQDSLTRSLMIRHDESGESTVAIAFPSGGGPAGYEQSVIRFQRFGTHHVLQGIERAGDMQGLSLAVPRSVRMMASTSRPTPVTVAMSRPAGGP